MQSEKISFVALDGSNSGGLNYTGASPGGALGEAIATAAGRIYWANPDSNKISFANLDGTGGGGDLNTAGATLDFPSGVAIDVAGGRIYWADGNLEKIWFADLGGSGGGEFNTAGATMDGPTGVAVDPAGGRLYWANTEGNKISFANLNGSGGGDLTTTGATVAFPQGVAVDTAAGRIYWANSDGNKISFANLNGSGGADLNTTGATSNLPVGVAVDPAGGRIYWASLNADKISFARLDGSGGGDIPTLGATLGSVSFPVLLFSPRPAGSPQVSGGATTGSVLSCTQGAWAPDLSASFLFQAPQSFAYQWSRDGADVAGATQSTLSADAPGAYRCRVTAQNHAGAATQTSEPHEVALPAFGTAMTLPTFGTATKVSLALAGGRIPAKGPVTVLVANANDFGVSGSVSGQTTKAVTVSRKRRVKLKAKRFSVAANTRRTVRLRLPKPLRALLAAKGRLSLRLSAKVTDPAGNTRTVTKKIRPKLKAKKRPRRT